VLIYGWFDSRTVRLFDCRYKKAQETVWNLEGEVERILWSNADSQYFYVSSLGKLIKRPHMRQILVFELLKRCEFNN
jgi:hypothetical protein